MSRRAARLVLADEVDSFPPAAWKTELTVTGDRIVLHKIPWGLPDRALGRAVCASIENVMPPTPWTAPRGNDWAFSLAGWSLVALVSLVLIGIATAVR